MRHVFLILTMMVSMTIHAGTVTKTDALQKAAEFMQSLTGRQAELKVVENATRRAMSLTQTPPYYVFNQEGGGFVIVSGNDRTAAILGYSATSTFDESTIPAAMRSLLNEYAEGIRYLELHDIQPTVSRRAARAKATIAPLIQSRWNQGAPYNHFCPVAEEEQTVTGCVATAMAQLMNYYQWPAATKAEIPAYTSLTHKFAMESVAAGTAIQWSDMSASYSNQYLGTSSEDAVAQLMMLCGQSVKMDYNLNKYGGSGAPSNDVAAALVNYFDYEETTTRWIERIDYSYSQWQELLYAELQAGRPVFYSGQSTGGGHAFLCDGYSSDDFFHVNWGWGGYQDNYFRLSLLDPDDQGIGGSATSDGYAIGQGCIIGVKRSDGVPGTSPIVMTVRDVSVTTTDFTRLFASSFFVIHDIAYTLHNTNDVAASFDIALRILNADGSFKEDIQIEDGTKEYLPYEYAKQNLGNTEIGAGYADGTYQMLFVCRRHGDTEWLPCSGAQANTLIFTIKGRQLTFDTNVFDLVVTDQTYSGNNKAFSPHTVKMTIQNNGIDFRSDVYYYLNPQGTGDDFKYDGYYPATFIDIAAGSTTDIAFNVTPRKSGDNVIRVVTTNGGERQLGRDITINVTAVGKPQLGVLSVANAGTDGRVAGRDLDITLSLSNVGEANFVDTIHVQVYRVVDSWLYQVDNHSEAIGWVVDLQPGQSASQQFVFDKLSADESYLLYVTYHENETLKAWYSPQYTMTAVGAQPKLEIVESSIANSYMEAGEVKKPTFSLTLKIKNTGDADFEGSLIRAGKGYSETYSGWFNLHNYDETQSDVKIAVGETLEYTTSFDEISYFVTAYGIHKYVVTVSSNQDGDQREIYNTGEFTFVDQLSGGGIQGDVTGDGRVNGSDIQAIINLIVADEYLQEADINEDGRVNGSDIQAIINIIVNSD